MDIFDVFDLIEFLDIVDFLDFFEFFDFVVEFEFCELCGLNLILLVILGGVNVGEIFFKFWGCILWFYKLVKKKIWLKLYKFLRLCRKLYVYCCWNDWI